MPNISRSSSSDSISLTPPRRPSPKPGATPPSPSKKYYNPSSAVNDHRNALIFLQNDRGNAMRRHKQPKAKIVASPLLATRMQMFQHRYWKARERAKNDPDPQVLIDFDSKEFFQTTRREPDPKGGERLLPNQEDLFAGVLGEERIRVPRGAYPPNTAGAEHSHPKKGNQSDYVTSTVSLGDLRSSFEELTNENHYAGTKMEFAQMYDPRSNRGFAYNGVLMEDCYPIYFEVVIPDHLKINVPEDYDMSQGLHIPGTAPDSPKLTPTNVPKHWPGPEYQPSLNPGAAQS